MTDHRLHAVFGVLFILSFFLADVAKKALPSWSDPTVGVLSLAVALIWLTTFFLTRGKVLEDELVVLRDRLDRADRRIKALEDELAV